MNVLVSPKQLLTGSDGGMVGNCGATKISSVSSVLSKLQSKTLSEASLPSRGYNQEMQVQLSGAHANVI